MGTFNELNLSKPLLKALADIGFENPTTIQEKAYPVIMSGKDAVVIAQTGTGKTLSYLLPILRQLTYSELRHPRVLIIVPTRELVVQVVSEMEKLTVYMSLRVFGVYGASNINTQKQKVYDGLDILVATPGRLIDLTLSRTLQFSAVKKLVIDEVDEMLNLGFRSQLLKILEILPLKRQNLMFSATLNEDVELMIEKYFNVPDNCLVIRSVQITVSGETKFLDIRDVTFVNEYNSESIQGAPKYYANWDEDTVIVAPTPDQAYTIQINYILKPTGLSSSTATTYLSQQFPNGLLYACLVEAYGFLKGPQDMLQYYENRYKQAIEGFSLEQMGRRRTDEFLDGEPRIVRKPQ